MTCVCERVVSEHVRVRVLLARTIGTFPMSREERFALPKVEWNENSKNSCEVRLPVCCEGFFLVSLCRADKPWRRFAPP
jgi:hypothetical protein